MTIKKYCGCFLFTVSWVCSVPIFASAVNDYTLFEAGQVRPMAQQKNGKIIYVVNTPDDRLEIYKVRRGRLVHQGSVAVGLRPVSVAVKNNKEVWVVNHLSDSVSVVNVGNPRKPRVIRTLWVGDEPRDIVFAGKNSDRAFITTAHRGQNNSIDPQLTTAGIGRADVWVFDANRLSSAAGGKPISIVTLFSDTPRALTVSPDGSTVYAAAFNSGNQTITTMEEITPAFEEHNTHGEKQPHTGLITKLIGDKWINSLGHDVTSVVNFNLPDYDVFTIDANAAVPVEIKTEQGPYTGVGTTLFNMVVNPVSGAIYVSNTEANNFTRFEGPGTDPNVNTTTRGNISASRITIIKDGRVTPIHLNKHINYEQCCEVNGNAEARKSLAFPRDMAVSADGKTLYVAAFGSGKVGVFDTRKIETNTFIPSERNHIKLSGGGPTGLLLNESLGFIYVLTRFNNSISVINLSTKEEVDVVSMHNPETNEIVAGRPLLYDAFSTSSHGDSACASCHVDGDMDHLAWDLGDPTALLPDVPGTAGAEIFPGGPLGTTTDTFTFVAPFCDGLEESNACIPNEQKRFASHKGPMTTQTLRGMANHGAMHWRGDRTGGTVEAPGAQPNDGMFDENAAFTAFNIAFPGLLGSSEQPSEDEMQRFADFSLQITLPPNPIRNLETSKGT